MPRCESCGRDVSPSHSFCPFCGKPIARQSAPPGLQNLIPAQIPIEVAILGVIVLFDFINAAYGAYEQSQEASFCAAVGVVGCGGWEGFDIFVALYSLVTGYFILTKQQWGLWGSVGLAVLSLIQFPWGTLLGLVMVVLFTRPAVRSWFDNKPTVLLPASGQSAGAGASVPNSPQARPPPVHSGAAAGPSAPIRPVTGGEPAAAVGMLGRTSSPSDQPLVNPVSAPSLSAQAYCTKCGAPLPARSAFCGVCGVRIG